jgi:hypothetical protein
MHATATGEKTALIYMRRFAKTFTALMILFLSETLLNIVKIRYTDMPVFLDISQVITTYSLQQQINLSAGWSDALVGDSQSVGGSGTYVDSPTIIYNPLMGRKFTKQILTPIPPASVFSLIQAGWPVTFVMRVSTDSINGINNAAGGALRSRPADPKFIRLLELLTDIQESGSIGTRLKQDKGEASMVFLRHEPSEDMVAKGKEVRDLLGVDQEADELKLVLGAIAQDDRELAVLTRSVLEILIELGSYIEAPAEHIEDGRVFRNRIDEPGFEPLIRIHSSPKKPKDPFVAVSYQDHWFWIDQTDRDSKRMLAFVMLLFSMAEPEGATMPTVTIPAK